MANPERDDSDHLTGGDDQYKTIEPDIVATSLLKDRSGNTATPDRDTSDHLTGADDSLDKNSAATTKEEGAADFDKDKKVETSASAKSGAKGSGSQPKTPEKVTSSRDQAGGDRGHRSHDRRDDRGRGGHRGGRGAGDRDKSYGNQFDPSTQKDSDDPAAIRKQVEFYFSDANLARDKFLFEKVEGPKNTPVPIKTIHSFKRMAHFKPYEAVINALKESDFLEVTEDEEVKRKVPLPADFENKTLEEITRVVEDAAMARSVYIKGFGGEKATTQFDIEAWVATFGTVNQVRLRRGPDKTFKGSVFVEFDSEDTAKAFLGREPKPKYEDSDLSTMSKKAYCDEKVEQIREGKSQPNSSYVHERHHEGRGSDDRDWRERRDEDTRTGHERRDGHDRYGRRDRNADGEAKKEDGEKKTEQENEKEPAKAEEASKEASKEVTEEDKGTKKRAREDDGKPEGEPTEKKVLAEET